MSKLACICLLIHLLAGCATAPPEKAPVQQTGLLEANMALDALNEQTGSFFSEAAELSEQIRLLYNTPGWSDFGAVLDDYPELRDPDSAPRAAESVRPAKEEWEAKWGSRWDDLMTSYHGLVDRSSIMEAKRMAALERLYVVETRYIAAAMAAFNNAGYDEGRAVYGIVDTLGRIESDLEAWAPGKLGLYPAPFNE